MCNTSAPGEEMSVMGVYNRFLNIENDLFFYFCNLTILFYSTAFASTINRDLANFQRLFRAKAMLHHYTEYLEVLVIPKIQNLNLPFAFFLGRHG